jgi:hypothetical protein
MYWCSIHNIDCSSLPFVGMASPMFKTVRTAQMLNIDVVQSFTATKVQCLINCLS